MPIELNSAPEVTVAPIRNALGAAPINNAALTGSPSAPTPPIGDNTTRLATTEYVLANSSDFDQAAADSRYINLSELPKICAGVTVSYSNGTRVSYAPTADTDIARGLALEAAHAAALAAASGGLAVTIDLSPGNYGITKKYSGISVGGYRTQFAIADKMTVRLNGARLYQISVSVAHNALVVGDWYIISGTEGATANWIFAGAANNNGGTIFQATQTAVNTGTGVVYPATQAMFCPAYVSGVMGASDWSLLGPGTIEGTAPKSAKANFSNEIGFNTSASRRWCIDGITFKNFQGTAFQANNASFSNDATGYGTGWKGSTGRVSNCNFDRNNLGVATYAGNEYITFVNCTVNDNISALDIYSGNTKLIGCDASTNGTTSSSIAMRIRRAAAANDQHGCWIGGHITHNVGFAINMEAGATDSQGKISSTGFIFSGVTFGADSITTNKIQSLGGGLNLVGCYVQSPFFASATPTGMNMMQNCFVGGFPGTADDITSISDLSTAERAMWKFLDNTTLVGPWIHNDVHPVFANDAASDFSLSCTTTNASRVVTTASTTGLLQGMTVVGTGIPANTHIMSVDSSTQITISSAATVSATNTLAIELVPNTVYKTSSGEIRIKL